MPARSLRDMRARGAWLGHWADGESEQSRDDHRAVVATLRADIERMGQRLGSRMQAPLGIQIRTLRGPSRMDSCTVQIGQSGTRLFVCSWPKVSGIER